MTHNIAIPDGMELMTADEVAECLPYDDPTGELYRKLWSLLGQAKRPTPLGGDGTDGTVEYPDARDSLKNDDKVPHWWQKLTREEAINIALAYKKEYPDDYTGMEDDDYSPAGPM